MATTPNRPIHWTKLAGTALVVTLFLYFIDEGRYSLSGLFTVGNLVAMSFYLLGLLVGLFGIAVLFARHEPSFGRTAMVLMLGSAVGVMLTVAFFYLLHGAATTH